VRLRAGHRRARTGWGGRAACYGANIAAICSYLYAGQFLSKNRTADALAQLFGVPLCGGTVAAFVKRHAADVRASGVIEAIKTGLRDAEVAHFDETGFRVQARLQWVHSASTEKGSLLTVHPKRGTAAMDQAGILPRFRGIAVHDAWAPYDTYTGAGHCLCAAHYADVGVMPTWWWGRWSVGVPGVSGAA